MLDQCTEDGKDYIIHIKSDYEGRSGSLDVEADPLAQIGKIISESPVPDANAYGYVGFEVSQFYFVDGAHSKWNEHSLIHFMIPALEIIIDSREIKVRCLDCDNLAKVNRIIASHGNRGLPKRKILSENLPEANSLENREYYEEMVRNVVKEIQGDPLLQKAIVSRPVWFKDSKLDIIGTANSAFADPCARKVCFDFGSAAAAVISPEPMVIVTNGNVRVTPLAGTRGRSADPVEDKRLTDDLLTDKKEQMEHLFSVAEVYREMKHICPQETVSVFPLGEIQFYRTVQHLASTVHGQLSPGVTVWDCLRVHAPAVTISGVNKKAALNVIFKNEREARGLYSSSMGWISKDGFSGDLAIAIRGVFQTPSGVKLQAGAGIMGTSVEKYEFKETWKKMNMIYPHVLLLKNTESESEFLRQSM